MKLDEHASASLAQIRQAGLYKTERVLSSAQGRSVTVAAEDRKPLLNFCANNYLALANDERIKDAAAQSLQAFGVGMASVRFICGTHQEHTQLEQALASFLGTEGAVLFGSCFDANAGLFEALLGPEDVIISDALNHASIIDGVRLCKARRLRYANGDMRDLARCLTQSADARLKLIVTDGVFSMDGTFAPLDEICELAEQHGAEVAVDDSHAVGFVGASGRGTPERFGVESSIAIRTGTLGKALGGSLGGYVAASATVVELLRQRARPYLFSNALPPYIAAAGRKALEIVDASPELGPELMRKAVLWRSGLKALGFRVLGDEHPIVPVMMPSPQIAAQFARELEFQGVYVAPFAFPVVPIGTDRIRTQVSSSHTEQDLSNGLQAFETVGRRLGVLS